MCESVWRSPYRDPFRCQSTLYFAGQGIQQQWKMKRDMLSPRYTTRLSDLLQVR
ncbi:DUF4113 domain-containing protein [Citrobacter gillenii]|nr:DUF4113 domain-containing protein [Citrobacter gillenii]